MNIDFIKTLIKQKKIRISIHAIEKIVERELEINQVLESVLNGQIIEEYDSDYPYPSCLILGRANEKVIHTVCSFSEPVFIITAYEPDLNKWENDYKIRKKV